MNEKEYTEAHAQGFNDGVEFQLAKLQEIFKFELYIGIKDPRCRKCEGKGFTPAENHDDPKWLCCIDCQGTGLGPELRKALGR